jgi:hypothetical protein
MLCPLLPAGGGARLIEIRRALAVSVPKDE